jgi:hypothetical protein
MDFPTSEIDAINFELEAAENAQSNAPLPVHLRVVEQVARQLTNLERLSIITHIPSEMFIAKDGPNGNIFVCGWDEYQFKGNEIIQNSRSVYE